MGIGTELAAIGTALIGAFSRTNAVVVPPTNHTGRLNHLEVYDEVLDKADKHLLKYAKEVADTRAQVRAQAQLASEKRFDLQAAADHLEGTNLFNETERSKRQTANYYNTAGCFSPNRNRNSAIFPMVRTGSGNSCVDMRVAYQTLSQCQQRLLFKTVVSPNIRCAGTTHTGGECYAQTIGYCETSRPYGDATTHCTTQNTPVYCFDYTVVGGFGSGVQKTNPVYTNAQVFGFSAGRELWTSPWAVGTEIYLWGSLGTTYGDRIGITDGNALCDIAKERCADLQAEADSAALTCAPGTRKVPYTYTEFDGTRRTFYKSCTPIIPQPTITTSTGQTYTFNCARGEFYYSAPYLLISDDPTSWGFTACISNGGTDSGFTRAQVYYHSQFPDIENPYVDTTTRPRAWQPTRGEVTAQDARASCQEILSNCIAYNAYVATFPDVVPAPQSSRSTDIVRQPAITNSLGQRWPINCNSGEVFYTTPWLADPADPTSWASTVCISNPGYGWGPYSYLYRPQFPEIENPYVATRTQPRAWQPAHFEADSQDNLFYRCQNIHFECADYLAYKTRYGVVDVAEPNRSADIVPQPAITNSLGQRWPIKCSDPVLFYSAPFTQSSPDFWSMAQCNNEDPTAWVETIRYEVQCEEFENPHALTLRQPRTWQPAEAGQYNFHVLGDRCNELAAQCDNYSAYKARYNVTDLPQPDRCADAAILPTAASVGLKPLPSVSIGIAPLPSAASVGIPALPTAASVGIAPLPTAASVGLKPLPTAASVGLKPLPTAASVAKVKSSTPNPTSTLAEASTSASEEVWHDASSSFVTQITETVSSSLEPSEVWHDASSSFEVSPSSTSAVSATPTPSIPPRNKTSEPNNDDYAAFIVLGAAGLAAAAGTGMLIKRKLYDNSGSLDINPDGSSPAPEIELRDMKVDLGTRNEASLTSYAV